MESDEFDRIAGGRALISDPYWVAKVRAGDAAELKGFEATTLAELV